MELTGLVLAAVGASDLGRRLVAPRAARAVSVAAVLLLCALAGAALGADPASSAVLAVVPAACAIGWLGTVRPDRAPLGFAPVVVLAAVAAAGLAFPPGTVPASIGSAGTPVGLVVLVAGGALFLLESANLVVRAALRSEDVPADDEPSPPRRLFARSDRAAVDAPDPRTTHTLRGGRIIGPLERIVLAGLVLAQAYPVVAALIAAKGIVRFPEISRDRDRGTQAEYFLVGSMVSWVQALAVAALVWLGAR
ncbi:hypothetical protein [Microbacterium gilvum]|uniref:Uncharacterized protein n=1 Tax=Microbacterium gilvum TaxID=1336204 RepID=A0ABP9ADD2_9MICO